MVCLILYISNTSLVSIVQQIFLDPFTLAETPQIAQYIIILRSITTSTPPWGSYYSSLKGLRFNFILNLDGIEPYLLILYDPPTSMIAKP